MVPMEGIKPSLLPYQGSGLSLTYTGSYLQIVTIPNYALLVKYDIPGVSKAFNFSITLA